MVEARLDDFERRLSSVEGGGGGGGDDSLIPARKPGGTDAQVLKKVSTRLQDFEAQITAQLSNMQSDFDKKLSHVNRGASSVKPMDATGASAGLDTMAEDLDQLKYDVGELKDCSGITKVKLIILGALFLRASATWKISPLPWMP